MIGALSPVRKGGGEGEGLGSALATTPRSLSPLLHCLHLLIDTTTCSSSLTHPHSHHSSPCISTPLFPSPLHLSPFFPPPPIYPAMSSTASALLMTLSSSSSGSASITQEVVSTLDNIYIAGWHVPLALFIVVVVLLALLLVCAIVGSICQGCCLCVSKTEEVVDDTVKDFKGGRAQKKLLERRQKLALIRAGQRSEDVV